MFFDPTDPTQEAIYGGLVISLDDGGAVTGFYWHFDYYYGWATRSNGRPYLPVYEHFTLDGYDLEWVDATPDVDGDTNGTVTGMFKLLHHLEDRINKESIRYEPFLGSPREMSFTFVIEPVIEPRG
jgi:hypothetical protein